MNTMIAEELNQFRTGLKVPAIVAGIVSRNGETELATCGIRRRHSAAPVEEGMQWHIGSCAKSITAVLYAKLVEAGKANWGESVAALFPDLADRIHSTWAKQTVDSLFHCRSGLRANLTRSQMREALVDQRPLDQQRY